MPVGDDYDCQLWSLVTVVVSGGALCGWGLVGAGDDCCQRWLLVIVWQWWLSLVVVTGGGYQWWSLMVVFNGCR